VAMAIVLAIPISDTALAILRRVGRGVPMFTADREHLHHRLLALGLSQWQAVLALWTAAALLAMAGVHVACGERGRAATIVLVPMVAVFLLHRLGMLTFTDTTDRARRRATREVFTAVRVASRRIRLAADLEELCHCLEAATPGVRAQAITLRLAREDRSPVLEPPRHAGTTQFLLDPANRSEVLEVVWQDPGPACDRDTESALELLARDVGAALKRIEARTAPGVSLRELMRRTLDQRDRERRALEEGAAPGTQQ
jgi:UDP-GlcNAc:undecaprenyl-phosphate/decaprenyl-phosphate GlcNAc-1-phosphate transferase